MSDIFDAIIQKDISALYKILKETDAQNQLESDNLTPLHFAVGYGVEPAIVLLLSFGANMYAVDCHDESPIELAKKVNEKILNLFTLFLKAKDLLNIDRVPSSSDDPMRKQSDKLAYIIALNLNDKNLLNILPNFDLSEEEKIKLNTCVKVHKCVCGSNEKFEDCCGSSLKTMH